MAALTWILVYWLSIGGLLGVISIMLHRRGSDLSWKERLHDAGQRFSGLIPVSALLILIAAGAGAPPIPAER